MSSEPVRHIARIDKQELDGMPSIWSNCERGRYLRHLLRTRGIDPGALFHIEYYPYRGCWLFSQTKQPGRQAGREASLFQNEEKFFLQTLAQLRHAARSAFAAVAATSIHFASHGCAYALPPKSQEVSAGDLAGLLGRGEGIEPRVQFTAEGGWQTEPSEN
ncbi:MAG TPA: hypothetical protein VGY58_04535 [Gemmataceae bacterium]|jgi:hypothetical protein|nr:hypothetical protein [Gemmataceae bacterium]